MSSAFSTFLHLLGFSLGMYLLARYRLWKASRASIPMEWNPKTQQYEADLTLKKWERRAKIAMVAFALATGVVGYLFITTMPDPNGPPQFNPVPISIRQ